ncbi:hypothetical protein Tco_0046752 [Tanacetum coccineum]
MISSSLIIESDPQSPQLGRPFLRIAHALIDVYGEEIILRDGDERLILNMRHDTSSYSNKPKKESINMIDIYNVSHEDYLEDLFANEKITNQQSGKLLYLLIPILTYRSLIIIIDLIWEEFEAYLISDSFPLGNDDPVDLLLEEFADELALITFPPKNDDLPFDIESDLREIEFCLTIDPTEDKIKESKLLIDELDPPRSSDFLPSPKCDSVLYEDFSEVDALPSTNNEDKDFNPPLYELPFHKEVPGSETLLSFSSENEEKDCPDFEDSCSWFCPSFTRASNPQLHYGNPISKSYQLTFIFEHTYINLLRNYIESPIFKNVRTMV